MNETPVDLLLVIKSSADLAAASKSLPELLGHMKRVESCARMAVRVLTQAIDAQNQARIKALLEREPEPFIAPYSRDCPVCGRNFRINKNGSLRNHDTWAKTRCPGSGMKPTT